MKFIFLNTLVCIIFLIFSECFAQETIDSNRVTYITVRAIDENGLRLEGVEVIIRGIDLSLRTDINGEVFIEMERYRITPGQELLIEGRLDGYCMRDTPHHYIVRNPEQQPNFTTIELYRCPSRKSCGFISLKDYIKEHGIFSIGFGFGYRKGDQVSLSNIPSNIRTGRPHPDDVKYRPNEILDPNNPDNYLIIENTVRVALEHRISLDIHFRFWGILNIAIKTSQIKDSKVIEHENYFRKSYIKEGSPGGDALIYYLVRSKNRSFFDVNSFSLPIYVTYPVFYCGKNKEVIFHLVGGTNLLLPDKISLEAEKGWHRFNERQKDTTFDLGELKETEFFAGLDVERAFTKSIRFGLEFTLVYTEYQEHFSVPLSLQQSNKMLPSLRLNFTKLFGSK